MTPLMSAARSAEDDTIIRLLIEAGADVRARENDGLNALMMNLIYSDSTAAARALIDAGTDLRTRDNYGRSASRSVTTARTHHCRMPPVRMGIPRSSRGCWRPAPT